MFIVLIWTLMKFLSTHPSRSATDMYNIPYLLFMFLSTHPSRSATRRPLCQSRKEPRFYPRTPRGVRPFSQFSGIRIFSFYPRTPRGVRPLKNALYLISHRFLSTHPSRSATKFSYASDVIDVFLSTHPSRSATCRNKQANICG